MQLLMVHSSWVAGLSFGSQASSLICFRVVIEKHPTALLLLPLPHVREHCKGNFKTTVTFNRDRAISVAAVLRCRARGHVFDPPGPIQFSGSWNNWEMKALQTVRTSQGSARQRSFTVYYHNHRYRQRTLEHVLQRTHFLWHYFSSLPGSNHPNQFF